MPSNGNTVKYRKVSSPKSKGQSKLKLGFTTHLSLQHPCTALWFGRSKASFASGERGIGYWQSSQPSSLRRGLSGVTASRVLVAVQGSNRLALTSDPGTPSSSSYKLSLALEGHAEAAECEEAEPVGLGAGRRFRRPPPTSTRYALPNPNSSFGDAALGRVTRRADNDLARDSGVVPQPHLPAALVVKRSAERRPMIVETRGFTRAGPRY
ncbi:hypothetical protein DFH08DRAFT_827023 [Mycena albidolilacea]|uniref:Uncharacterized protein n=1 Tax=Mycena albidolilacea TaxID=1033008 RepID=A0AAD7E8M1_9AGAR|nr:hypothetical protein DFH08DRAFT_827023 [Mycena albidolilacea]